MAKRKFAEAEFCLWCGTRSLERDDYSRGEKQRRNERTRYECSAPEFVCQTCGMGFQLSASRRHQNANALFKSHRAANFVDKN